MDRRVKLSADKRPGEDYAMETAMGFASMMLVELAEKCLESISDGTRMGFPSTENFVATMLGFQACKAAMIQIEKAFPNAGEVTEDAYWKAMEILNAAGLDFEDLFNFHFSHGGEA